MLMTAKRLALHAIAESLSGLVTELETLVAAAPPDTPLADSQALIEEGRSVAKTLLTGEQGRDAAAGAGGEGGVLEGLVAPYGRTRRPLPMAEPGGTWKAWVERFSLTRRASAVEAVVSASNDSYRLLF